MLTVLNVKNHIHVTAKNYCMHLPQESNVILEKNKPKPIGSPAIKMCECEVAQKYLFKSTLGPIHPMKLLKILQNKWSI